MPCSYYYYYLQKYLLLGLLQRQYHLITDYSMQDVVGWMHAAGSCCVSALISVVFCVSLALGNTIHVQYVAAACTHRPTCMQRHARSPLFRGSAVPAAQ